jgi:phosphoenolpyruvate carboxykinase (ATP)
MLTPSNTWSDQQAYEKAARKLAAAFHANFDKYADMVPHEVCSAGPAKVHP